MEIAKILVNQTTGHCMVRRRIPAGLAGGTVSVEFDDPIWDRLVKTVVFRGTEVKAAEFDGKTAVIPWEVLEHPGPYLFFGIWGSDPDSALQLPLIEVRIGPIEDATDPTADPGTDPTLPIWAQLQQDLEELKKNGVGGVGGEAKAFYVSITGTDNSYTADKTLAELQSAYEAGRSVYAIVTAQIGNFKVTNDVWGLSTISPSAFFFTSINNKRYLMAAITSTSVFLQSTELAEASAIPSKLPSPGGLTFTGGVSATYDGTSDVEVKIPNSGAAFYVTITGANGEYTTDKTNAEITDAYNNGQPVNCIFTGTENEFFAEKLIMPLLMLQEEMAIFGTYLDGVSWVVASYYPLAQVSVREMASKNDIPQALPNPNKLTFSGAVTGEYDGRRGVTIEIPKPDSGGNADWNQNDEAASDYVKNRTHYETMVEEYVIYEGTLATFGNTEDIPIQYTIPVGTSITAYYNGAELATLQASQYQTNSDHVICNFTPDLQLFVYNDTQTATIYNGIGTETFKFVAKDLTVLKTLDEKYIPETISRKTDIPTDDHINELINTALGVIENGTY